MSGQFGILHKSNCMAKSKNSIGKRIAVAALAAASLVAPATKVDANVGSSAPSSKNISVRDSAIEAQVAPKPVTDNKKLLNGRIKPHLGAENRFLNQRQYRKKCRQNPTLMRSKKHRSKN
jgi:hypothetical protein